MTTDWLNKPCVLCGKPMRRGTSPGYVFDHETLGLRGVAHRTCGYTRGRTFGLCDWDFRDIGEGEESARRSAWVWHRQSPLQGDEVAWLGGRLFQAEDAYRNTLLAHWMTNKNAVYVLAAELRQAELEVLYAAWKEVKA